MGVVIRPAAFAREIAASPRFRPIRALRARWYDFPVAALFMAFMALAWMLALAGTAFAVRTVLVLCVAMLAGRARPAVVPGKVRSWR
jgi:hypothetical protein